MEEKANRDEERWDSIVESVDLLFSKFEDLDRNQQKMEAQFGVSSQVISQMLKDQQLLAKQLEATGQAVAQLTLRQKQVEPEPPPASEKGETSGRQRMNQASGSAQQQNPFPFGRGGDEFRQHHRSFVPKLSCPRFNGANPGIWKAKCEDYF